MVFIGSLLMMCGYLSGMAVFGAKIRDNTPIGKAGRFQGVRIVSQVLVPSIIGPKIAEWVLQNAEKIVNSDGTTSFIPSANIFLAALIAILVVGFFSLGLFVKNFFPSYMDEKGKNLATKEDIEEITRKTEEVQQEFKEKIELFNKYQQMEKQMCKQYESMYGPLTIDSKYLNNDKIIPTFLYKIFDASTSLAFSKARASSNKLSLFSIGNHLLIIECLQQYCHQ